MHVVSIVIEFYALQHSIAMQTQHITVMGIAI